MNLIAPILITKEVSRIMVVKTKVQSILVLFSVKFQKKTTVISFNKNAINGLTKTLALDLASSNILVNSVSPGVIQTQLTKKSWVDQE